MSELLKDRWYEEETEERRTAGFIVCEIEDKKSQHPFLSHVFLGRKQMGALNSLSQHNKCCYGFNVKTNRLMDITFHEVKEDDFFLCCRD